MALSAGIVTGWAMLSGFLVRRRSLTSPDAGEGSRGLLGGERWEALMADSGQPVVRMQKSGPPFEQSHWPISMPPDNTPAPSSLTAADSQEDAATIVLT